MVGEEEALSGFPDGSIQRAAGPELQTVVLKPLDELYKTLLEAVQVRTFVDVSHKGSEMVPCPQ